MFSPRYLLAAFLLFSAACVRAQTVTTTTVDSAGTTGLYTSQAVVNGAPAVAYYNASTSDLKYARNSQPDGLGYWSVSTVDTAGTTGLYPSLAIVAGNPAISYYDQTNLRLRFARNSQPDGLGYWTVSTVDGASGSGQFSSLVVVAGNPAISYYDGKYIRFARNSLADGSGTWTLSTIDTAAAATIQSTSMTLVNGLPFVAYPVATGARIARNSLADGSGIWSTTELAVQTPLNSLSLAVVNGYPSLIGGNSTYPPTFARCGTTDGTGKYTTSSITNVKVSGESLSLATVYGTPVFASGGYYGMQLVRASSPDGSGGWTATTVDSSRTSGQYVSLVVVNGNPAISYAAANPSLLKHTTLRFFQSLTVEQPSGTALTSGTSRSFTAAVGGSASLMFTVRNTGGADLTGLSLSKDGANAAEFSYAGPVATTVAPGGSTTFTVSFSPSSAGAKTAAVHLASNDSTQNPFDINLTGAVSIPHLVVEQPAGTALTSGSGSVTFGTLAQGTSKGLTFTVRNTGSADLIGLAVTVDGANGADFAVSAAPGSTTVAPQASTTFTVQFHPAASTVTGSRTATVHLASNDPTTNPFNVAVTGLALSYSQDGDGDGMSDAAEFQLAALGFDYQKSQPALVSTLYTNAAGAGLYTTAQVQALYADAPLLSRDPATGQFTITLGVQKSADLIHYSPLPITAPQTTINSQGQVQFRFTSPDNAAFYRIEAN